MGELAYDVWRGAFDYEIAAASEMLFGAVHKMIHTHVQVVALAVSHVEHVKGSMSSGVLTLYWIMALLVDGVKLRTAILRHDVVPCAQRSHSEWSRLGCRFRHFRGPDGPRFPGTRAFSFSRGQVLLWAEPPLLAFVRNRALPLVRVLARGPLVLCVLL